MLASYIEDTQALLRDSLGLFTPVPQLTRWINSARVEIAELTGCINCLVAGQSPFGNQMQVGSWVVGAGITGTQPDAAPNALQVTTTSFQTIPGTESYPFDYANPYLRAQYAGVDRVLDVASVAVSWGNYRRVCDWWPWDYIQAYGRVWAAANFNYPFVFSTNGDGALKRVWLFPPPSIASDMEWDCFCLPKDLATDSDIEAIPEPFHRAVKYGAAALSFINTRPAMAELMNRAFMQALGLHRVASDRGKTPYFYR